MAIIFHSGFEMGLFNEWTTVYGSPTISTAQKHTGSYSMLCDTTSTTAFLEISTSNIFQISFWVMIDTLPGDEVNISGSGGVGYMRLMLQTDGTLHLNYDTDTTVVNGTTVLPSGASKAWKRISYTFNTSTQYAYLWIDGVLESSGSCGGSKYLYPFFGNIGTQTYKIYYDDFACSDSTGTSSDLGDIRCAIAACPRAQGTYATFDTTYPTADPHYTNYDDSPGTALSVMNDDYAEQQATTAAAETALLTSCSSLGLAAGDTIQAVNVMIYAMGASSSGIRVRLSSTNYDTDLVTSDAFYRKYYRLDPASNAWTQSNFDSLEAGMYTGANATNAVLFCVMVFVAYIPATSTAYTFTALGKLGTKPVHTRKISGMRAIAGYLEI